MNRRKLLAKVHVLKKERGLDEDTYRGAIEALFGVRSAADLTDEQLMQLVAHLDGRRGRTEHQGRPRNMDNPDRGRLLRKVEALLADARRPWAYAHAIARRMYGVQRVEWLAPDQIGRVIAALEYDRKRRVANGASE